MSVDSWDWMPGISVGPFQFGSDASAVIERLGLRKREPDCSGAFWESYEIPGHESGVTTEDNKISSVSCYEHLWYNSFDILNMNIYQARLILGLEEKSMPHPYVEGTLVVYYDRLGLTLFIDNGRIKSATCNACIDDA
jgi:hypothetical protein